MTNTNKQLELAKEAVKLIKEFDREAEIVAERFFSNVEIDESGCKIIIIEEYDEKKREYDLRDISSPIKRELYGAGPFGDYGLYDAIEQAKEDAKDEFETLDKDEFIKHIGGIFYTELRVEAIYERLKKIEEEAKELI